MGKPAGEPLTIKEIEAFINRVDSLYTDLID
jgi:hypothetical protein